MPVEISFHIQYYKVKNKKSKGEIRGYEEENGANSIVICHDFDFYI